MLRVQRRRTKFNQLKWNEEAGGEGVIIRGIFSLKNKYAFFLRKGDNPTTDIEKIIKFLLKEK